MSNPIIIGFAGDENEMLPEENSVAEVLRASAHELARSLAWIPGTRSSKVFAQHCRTLATDLSQTLRVARESNSTSPSRRLLSESTTLLESSFGDVYESLYKLRQLPHVLTPDGKVIPRVLAIAQECMRAAAYRCKQQVYSQYVQAFQESTALDLAELWALIAAMKLIILERLVLDARAVPESNEIHQEIAVCLDSLRRMNEIPWRQVVEPLIPFDRFLQQDPVGVYSRMEPESRDLYRNEIAQIAQDSDYSEEEVALAALEMAQQAHQSPCDDPRLKERISHVGDYIVAEGAAALKQKAGFRPSFKYRLQTLTRQYPDDFYFPSIALLTSLIAAAFIHFSDFDFGSFGSYVFILLVLAIPCSEAAIQIVNYIVLSFLRAHLIPKIDFHDGIPSSCVTLVTIPTLLLNEEQVRNVVDNLEVRSLGNHDKNLHFALLTDLPDSPTQPGGSEPLATLCAELVERLNHKYAGNGAGSFFLFHRERRYNPRERTWMGWERKRGKLLELNRYLRGEKDGYAIAIGNLEILRTVRFVIALDADTLLPRDVALRLIGTAAHPLNQAIVDPKLNIVVAGYGILQPRVGVSIRSATRSRLAKIWSGQAGLDIYTRAVSDVYQDLYNEGSYVGKGIYDVEIIHRVLDGRFPSNLLLSHDLIEGAYARSGLVSDIEVIEDYPTVYSAYNRRKHRWLRGDWQVAEWLFPKVPGALGGRVLNPISMVSRWKILDNLRRSLVEPATFLLFVLGWLALPGSAAYWTLAAICILLLPNIVRLLFHIARMTLGRNPSLIGSLPDSLFSANVSVLLTLTFIAHQTLVSLDAMVRALVRRNVTGQRLLEWVTAAQEEDDPRRRTALDIYLDWTPALAVGLGALVWFVRGRAALLVALPILILWGSNKLISLWLNRSPRARYEKSGSEKILLRQIALRTWRFFAEFGGADNGWLIPDNVREEGIVQDRRLSTTNFGMLLNSRQAACELGCLTVPEFVELTHNSLKRAMTLQRHHGHFYNWYDATTGEPLPPLIVSAVDSGNLVASLWTLEQGCLDQLHQPFLSPCLTEGIVDLLRELVQARVVQRSIVRAFSRRSNLDWLEALEWLPIGLRQAEVRNAVTTRDSQWFMEEVMVRANSITSGVRIYMPWLLDEFRPLRQRIAAVEPGSYVTIALQRIPEFIDSLQFGLTSLLSTSGALPADEESLIRELLTLLPSARKSALGLIGDLKGLSEQAGQLAEDTDFSVLLSPSRKMLSIALDAETSSLSAACYDQLASESRMATFVAIAKNDISQEAWFSLNRRYKLRRGRTVLLSWAGTMFEYLMPCLWMNTYPDTLLDSAANEAVRAQRVYGDRKGVPWGVSESASVGGGEEGGFGYFAFGIAALALRESHPSALVISPYSTMLALDVSPKESLHNIRRMERLGWLGPYGMYESVDFARADGRLLPRPEIARIWMAHHQGMSLLAIANSLCDGVVRRWFHKNPSVQSTELLLQEKPIAPANLRPVRLKVAA